jgi:hypothetical protein
MLNERRAPRKAIAVSNVVGILDAFKQTVCGMKKVPFEIWRYLILYYFPAQKKLVSELALPSKKVGSQKPSGRTRKKQGLQFLMKALFKVLSVGLNDHLPPNDPGNLK